ncbi:MAG TPA: hypothetical protein VGR57_04005 [Ktedonobacterales bacterium]|nr:hypothetical protein [Ktedonobacterales bacterium]
MDFPSGWPMVAAANVRRARPLSGGATPLVNVGDHVRPDQPIAERPTARGGRELILAGLAGRVAQIAPGRSVAIEGVATLIQGICGTGGAAAGTLHFLARGESVAVVRIPRGAVIVFPGQIPLTLLQRAAAEGAAALIGGSIGVRELEAFMRADMTSVLDGMRLDATHIPLPLVLTEGIGSFAMDSAVFQILSQRAGDVALIGTATDPRRAIRPEVLLALPLGSPAQPLPADDTITLGARVRLVAGPGRGSRGEVVYQFAQRQTLAPGLVVPAVRVRLEDGASQVVPVAFVERVG